jgi:hypothetical protein
MVTLTDPVMPASVMANHACCTSGPHKSQLMMTMVLPWVSVIPFDAPTLGLMDTLQRLTPVVVAPAWETAKTARERWGSAFSIRTGVLPTATVVSVGTPK